MKRFILIRHAKFQLGRHELKRLRQAVKRPWKKRRSRMGKRLKERGIFPDVILSSPAIRALETSKMIARALNFPLEK